MAATRPANLTSLIPELIEVSIPPDIDRAFPVKNPSLPKKTNIHPLINLVKHAITAIFLKLVAAYQADGDIVQLEIFNTLWGLLQTDSSFKNQQAFDIFFARAREQLNQIIEEKKVENNYYLSEAKKKLLLFIINIYQMLASKIFYLQENAIDFDNIHLRIESSISEANLKLQAFIHSDFTIQDFNEHVKAAILKRQHFRARVLQSIDLPFQELQNLKANISLTLETLSIEKNRLIQFAADITQAFIDKIAILKRKVFHFKNDKLTKEQLSDEYLSIQAEISSLKKLHEDLSKQIHRYNQQIKAHITNYSNDLKLKLDEIRRILFSADNQNLLAELNVSSKEVLADAFNMVSEDFNQSQKSIQAKQVDLALYSQQLLKCDAQAGFPTEMEIDLGLHLLDNLCNSELPTTIEKIIDPKGVFHTQKSKKTWVDAGTEVVQTLTQLGNEFTEVDSKHSRTFITFKPAFIEEVRSKSNLASHHLERQSKQLRYSLEQSEKQLQNVNELTKTLEDQKLSAAQMIYRCYENISQPIHDLSNLPLPLENFSPIENQKNVLNDLSNQMENSLYKKTHSAFSRFTNFARRNYKAIILGAIIGAGVTVGIVCSCGLAGIAVGALVGVGLAAKVAVGATVGAAAIGGGILGASAGAGIAALTDDTKPNIPVELKPASYKQQSFQHGYKGMTETLSRQKSRYTATSISETSASEENFHEMKQELGEVFQQLSGTAQRPTAAP